MHKLTLAALLICLWQPFSLSLAALLIVPQRQHNVTLPALLPRLQPLAAADITLLNIYFRRAGILWNEQTAHNLVED